MTSHLGEAEARWSKQTEREMGIRIEHCLLCLCINLRGASIRRVSVARRRRSLMLLEVLRLSEVVVSEAD